MARMPVIGLAVALAVSVLVSCGGGEGTIATGAEDAELPTPQFVEAAFEGALERGDERFGAGWMLISASFSADTVGFEIAEGEELARWTYQPLTGELSEGVSPVGRKLVEYDASELDPTVARKVVARGLKGHPDYGLVYVSFEQPAGAREPRWRATFHDESLENVSIWASSANGTGLRQAADAEQIRARAERRRAAELVDEVGGEAEFCRGYAEGLAAGKGARALLGQFREGYGSPPPGRPSARAVFEELVSRC